MPVQWKSLINIQNTVHAIIFIYQFPGHDTNPVKRLVACPNNEAGFF